MKKDFEMLSSNSSNSILYSIQLEEKSIDVISK